jgi:hypothetical protein
MESIITCTQCGIGKNISAFNKKKELCKDCLKKECPHCLEKHSNLKRHINIVHLELKEFKCEHCQFVTSSASNLKMHKCYRIGREQNFQQNLEKQLNAGSKSVPAGIIDICTDTEIIEVKHWNAWKQALGQIIVYSHYYPNHKKRVHFYGIEPSQNIKDTIKMFYDKYDITITSEEFVSVRLQKCPFLLVSGPKRGQECGSNVKDGEIHCGKHSKIVKAI